MCITHAYKPLLQNLFIKLVDHVVLRVTNYLGKLGLSIISVCLRLNMCAAYTSTVTLSASTLTIFA